MGSVYPLALRRPIYWSDTKLVIPFPLASVQDVSPSFDSVPVVSAKLPAELPPTSMSSIPLTVVPTPPMLSTRTRVFLGIAFTFILSVGDHRRPASRLNVIRPLFPV